MAQDDYKEGVDYEMVDKGGYKSRRFFTRAEKDAMKNPKAAAPKADTPKANPKPKAKPKADKPKFSVDMAEKAIDKAASKDQPMQSSPRPKPRPVDKTPTPVKLAKPGDITVSKLDKPAGNKPTSMARPEGTAAGMPGKKKPYVGTSLGDRLGAALGSYVGKQLLRSSPSDTLGISPAKYEKGGMIKEGSAKDMREDKAMAKKRGMTMKNWEKSDADKKHDAPKKMATGGSVRGGGCATRGKGFAGTF